ncbi:MAG TPA: ACP S-malonyltransferase [Dissulfurispiraceae bacterium]|nr:ACP S-malonyltransferase [Dissulfurispiraceae bacterium]
MQKDKGKIAVVFPGQGSQAVGMGKDFFEQVGVVKGLYEEASGLLGYDLAQLTFEGPASELNKTVRTQPSLLVASVAAYRALTLKGVVPSVVAGHSLGEYSALVAAGALSFADAVRMTEVRGRIMQEAVPEGTGLMAAILGMERKDLDDVCAGITTGYVAAANYNCPGQIVISGEKEAVEEAMKKALDSGAKRAVKLNVSIPSHCRLMEEAAKLFESALSAITLRDAKIPVICNADARITTESAVIRQALVKQLSHPVLWEDCVKAIAATDAGTFIEVGPGKVLSGLIKRIEPSVRIFNVENVDTLNKTLAAL